MVFCVVLAALLIMQVYFKRAYQGSLKEKSDELGSGLYSPKHTTSLSKISTSTNSTTYTGGPTVPDGVSVTVTKTATSSNKTEAIDAFATDL